MAEVSKAVSNRIAITRTVTTSIEVHGAEIAPALEAELFPNGAPANCDVRVLLTALGACLQRAVDDVGAKDQTHAMELADDLAPREQRDIARGDLRAALIGLRNMLGGTYGPSILTAYGLAGETPTDADELLQSAETCESLLRTRPIVEKAQMPGVTTDPKVIADGLAVNIQALRVALGTVRKEEREAQATRDERNEALAKWNARYSSIADIVTGLYEVAGKTALADRVRPTARRRSGATEASDEDTNVPTG